MEKKVFSSVLISEMSIYDFIRFLKSQFGGDLQVFERFVRPVHCHFGDGPVVVGFGVGRVYADCFGVILDGSVKLKLLKILRIVQVEIFI